MKHEAIFNMTLPLTVLGPILLAMTMAMHPVAFGYISLAVMGFGACLLCAARWPLYRQRRFLDLGSKGLDRTHRLMYRWAYVAIWVGVALALLVIAMQSALRHAAT